MNKDKIFSQLRNLVVVSGHYGCGKTNLSVNLALDYAKNGYKVTIVDMDLVNPYFRTSDFRPLLEEKGIEVITPVFGATNLDIPSLPAGMYSIFEKDHPVIVDVGGDDVGSTVLGRFRPFFQKTEYDMLYVINRFRCLDDGAEDTIEILREIEAVSGLKADMLVNNSHLMTDTTPDIIRSGLDFTEEISIKTGLPVLMSTLDSRLYGKDEYREFADKDFYPVDIVVKTGW